MGSWYWIQRIHSTRHQSPIRALCSTKATATALVLSIGQAWSRTQWGSPLGREGRGGLKAMSFEVLGRGSGGERGGALGFGLWSLGYSLCPMRALWAHRLPLWGELGEAHHTHQVCHAAGWLGGTPSYCAGVRRGRQCGRGAAGLRAVLTCGGGGGGGWLLAVWHSTAFGLQSHVPALEGGWPFAIRHCTALALWVHASASSAKISNHGIAHWSLQQPWDCPLSMLLRDGVPTGIRTRVRCATTRGA